MVRQHESEGVAPLASVCSAIVGATRPDLHVWEGLFHVFFLNPDVPESRDVYDVMVNFFDKHLGQ